MKLIILSDIHANLSALDSIFRDVKECNIGEYRLIILGDTINYGLRPNETLELLQKQNNVDILLAGNHEMALFGFEDDRFSSPRGRALLELTKKLISTKNLDYIRENFSQNYIEKEIDGKLYLFIHGSLDDPFWGTINIFNMNDKVYKKYDVVFSGHSHKPCFVEIFFDDNNSKMRDKKRTTFINAGSVGQPRNHSNQAQYVVFDTLSMEVSFNRVVYNIVEEQSIYQQYDVNEFYARRLGEGL